MEKIDEELLLQIADMHSIPQGSYNIRKNGECLTRNSTDEIQIVPKKDKQGIDVIVASNVKNKSVHIPVILTMSGLDDTVYNDFYIGENCDITIVAGCGIHNSGEKASRHSGVHCFHLEKNSTVKYIEKHLGVGNKKSQKILDPQTVVYLGDGSQLEMETIQLGGVSTSKRDTKAHLETNSHLVIKEKILTEDKQTAKTKFYVELNGDNSSVEVVSRSVAKNKSKQDFVSTVVGNASCFGHVECDGILLDNAQIQSSPKVVAKNINATLVHEAAIGKIAGDQLMKLQTLGLTEQEAETQIIKGFLK